MALGGETAMQQASGRLSALVLAGAVIGAGLALRTWGPGLQVPSFIVKYGGSALWGAMVYYIVAVAVGGLRPARAVLVALLVAACVELSRLYHTPELDAFRLTLAGKLLLGRVFSVWNIVAYAVGISAAAMPDFRKYRPSSAHILRG